MVCGGWPSSQRKRLVATQTLPVEINGWARTLSERVCVKSADQLWRLVCTANHWPKSPSSLGASAAWERGAARENKRPSKRHNAAVLQPNCAKCLECVQLAGAVVRRGPVRQREQAPRTPNASRGSSSSKTLGACEQVGV